MIKLIKRYKKPLRITIWIVTVLWMGMIFYFSSQPAEVSLNSSGKVLVTMDKLDKEEVQNISDRRVWNLQNTIRKYAHFIVYSVLGFLLAFSFIMINHKSDYVYLYSWFASALYGILDELHQQLVPGRAATIADMLLDALSAFIGTLFAFLAILIWRVLTKNQKTNTNTSSVN